MATEQIVVEYIAQVEGMKAQMKTLEASLKRVEKAGEESAKKISKEFQSTSSSLKQGATQIAGALGVAFGVHKIVEFGKESIKAFTEAEENANKLRFAVEKIGGEGSSAFGKLLKQSEELQKITIFSDDSIQQAQTALATFGLTSDQIEALIPKIADMASATGVDLATATQKAIQGINGQTRGLKEVGIQFADTGSKTENLAILTDKLTKFQGASADALETTVGKAKRLENAFGDIQEKIGEYLVNEGAQILDNFDIVFGGKGQEVATKRAIENSIKLQDEFNEKNLEKIKAGEKTKYQVIIDNNKFISELFKARGKQENAEQQKNIDAQIKNIQKFNEDLRNLGKENKIKDDATLGGKDKEVKEQKDLLEDLRNLDIQADEASLSQMAKTESEKIELARSSAIQQVRIAEKLAIDSGVAEADAKLISQNALTNINKTFNDKQSELTKTQNEKDFQDAIAEAERQGDELAKQEAINQKKRYDEYLKGVEDRKKVEQEFVNFIGSTLSGIAEINSNVSEKRIQENQEVNDAETLALQQQLDAKLISQEEYDRKKDELDKKTAEKEKEIKRRTFEANRQIMLIQTIMATAQATIAALGSIPYSPANIALAALTAAAGAVQIAVITSQPTPKFAKGGKVDGKLHSQGGTLIEAERDEWIINRNESMKNDKLLDAINKGNADKYIFDNFISPAIKEQQKKNADAKEKSFASNLANSMSLNFKDGNLLDSLKKSRQNDKEIAIYLGKKFEGNQRSNHKW